MKVRREENHYANEQRHQGLSDDLPLGVRFKLKRQSHTRCIRWSLFWLFVFLQRSSSSSARVRIFFSSSHQQLVDDNTDYSSRINVTSDEQGSYLSIQDARLTDEREFLCQVNGMEAGNGEGNTHLRVFGKDIDGKIQCPC